MNKQARTARQELITRLAALGFSFEEIEKLRRVSMALRKWFEYECGTEAGRIVRDEDEKPFFVREYRETWKPYAWKTMTTPIADREKGAIKRLEKILSMYPGFTYYLQTDPRGCALYLLQQGDVPEGKSPAAYYTNGIAVF